MNGWHVKFTSSLILFLSTEKDLADFHARDIVYFFSRRALQTINLKDIIEFIEQFGYQDLSPQQQLILILCAIGTVDANATKQDLEFNIAAQIMNVRVSVISSFYKRVVQKISASFTGSIN